MKWISVVIWSAIEYLLLLFQVSERYFGEDELANSWRRRRKGVYLWKVRYDRDSPAVKAVLFYSPLPPDTLPKVPARLHIYFESSANSNQTNMSGEISERR